MAPVIGEQIGAMIGRLAPNLLRRHIAHRAEHRARLGRASLCSRLRLVVATRFLGPVPAGETEIQDLERAVAGDEQILGFQIPVDDAPLMRGRKPGSDLSRIFDGLADGI